ncbi:hypothetical protein EDB83DRAFT_1762114 [Lactarius deliciosus]|nr:hypothetical protein EDB83DRAFT_1762114 [Lactarius deliciosus]
MRFERFTREFFLNVDGLHRQSPYGKPPGFLELTTTHLQWTQDGKKAPAVRMPHPEVTSPFSSKEGGAQVHLKIGLENDSNGHDLPFTLPPLALTEREVFKAQRSAHDYNQQQIHCVRHWRGMASRRQASKRPLLLAAVPPLLLGLQTLSAESVSSHRGTPVNDDSNTHDLTALHRKLVVSGQVTETEFWEGREHLLLAQAASDSQKKGRPGQLVDSRPQAVEGSENKIVIAPQRVHDV